MCPVKIPFNQDQNKAILAIPWRYGSLKTVFQRYEKLGQKINSKAHNSSTSISLMLCQFIRPKSLGSGGFLESQRERGGFVNPTKHIPSAQPRTEVPNWWQRHSSLKTQRHCSLKTQDCVVLKPQTQLSKKNWTQQSQNTRLGCLKTPLVQSPSFLFHKRLVLVQ